MAEELYNSARLISRCGDCDKRLDDMPYVQMNNPIRAGVLATIPTVAESMNDAEGDGRRSCKAV